MTNGEVIYAKTHADFLNQAFGTNYKGWMKCVWQYDSEWIVWMVRFNNEDRGWKNTFLSDFCIKEENINNIKIWDGKPIEDIHKKRIVVEIVDLDYTRKYIFRGKYVYDEEKSNPRTIRYHNKVSDEI